MKKPSIRSLTKKADILFAKAVKKRDCYKSRLSGLTDNLQCSHIYSRSNKAIRWDLDNALTLTAGEHLFWWHKEIAESVLWAKRILGDKKWKELEQKKNKPFKLTQQFLEERISFLTKYLEEYEAS